MVGSLGSLRFSWEPWQKHGITMASKTTCEGSPNEHYTLMTPLSICRGSRNARWWGGIGRSCWATAVDRFAHNDHHVSDGWPWKRSSPCPFPTILPFKYLRIDISEIMVRYYSCRLRHRRVQTSFLHLSNLQICSALFCIEKSPILTNPVYQSDPFLS